MDKLRAAGRKGASKKTMQNIRAEFSDKEKPVTEGSDGYEPIAHAIEQYITKHYNGKSGLDTDDFMKVASMVRNGSINAARKFASTLDTDPRDKLLGMLGQGVAEGYDPAEQAYYDWSQILQKDGYRNPNVSGADALKLVAGDYRGPDGYVSTIRNILTYVKQNRQVLGKAVSDRKTVKDAIIDIKNEFS